MNTQYLLWEPPSQSMKLKVYMFFSDNNNNNDFKNFFHAIGKKLDRYNQLTEGEWMSAPGSQPYIPNNENNKLLQNLLGKYNKDTGNDFCGHIMSKTYLPDSANDSNRMCIFITGTNPLNDNEERLHSAATVYFSNKFIKSFLN